MDEDRNVKDEDEFQGAAEERTADEETEGADLFSNLETENVPYNDEEELNPVVEQQVEESEEFEAEHIYVPSKDRYADDNEEEEEKDDDNDAVLLPRSPPPQDETNVSNYSSDIMVEEGYLPGVDDLPLFATKEAKLIDASNKEAEISVEALSEELRDLNDRIKIMKEHFKNVMQEVEHTNALFVSKQAEIHTESHLHQLSIRALGRGRSDTKKEQDEFDTLQSQLNTVHNETYKANEKLDEFKFQMKWNQEELEKWALAAKQKEDDQLALERYSRADEHKVKELTLMQEHLTREMQTVVTRLEGELTDTRVQTINDYI